MDSVLTATTPVLSVVVVVICGLTYLARCLNALCHQYGDQEFEIIVAYDETLEDIPIIHQSYPQVRLYTIHGMRTPEELASLGIRKARGSVVALTEDHCIPDEHWCERTLKVHTIGPHAAVGGTVECTSRTVLEWAFAYCDYYRYLNPVPEGLTSYLTVCNVAYKRQALEKIANAWENYFHETIINKALLTRGETLWLTPLLIVYQERKMRFFPAMRERYSFGWLFGGRRAGAITPQRRWLYILLAPAIPFLLLGRMLSMAWLRKKNMGIFFKAIPILTALTLAWSWGEFLGNLSGRTPKEVYIAR